MRTRNLQTHPIEKKKTERERDSEKEANGFDGVWAMSIPGESCGNPFVSKCQGKFKIRTPCILSKVNGKVFHFPRCYPYVSMSVEELSNRKRKVKSGPDKRTEQSI